MRQREFSHRSLQADNHPAGNEGAPVPVSWLDTLAPYQPVSSLEKIWARTHQVPLKLDWNEASIPPSPKVYEAIVSFLSQYNHLNWYPELGSASLCAALADYVSLPPENILVTNGSDDGLELVCKTYLSPGHRVVVPMPTYTHFLVFVEARGAEVVPFYSSDLFDPDVARLNSFISQGAQMVYLVNPNNPSGVTYTEGEVEDLLVSHPETLFIVDEAYFEFHGESVVKLISGHRNLVVTRTFSKCFGIAGLRIGYLCACAEIMTNLKKLFNPKSVNRLGQIAALACLSDQQYYKEYVREVTVAKALFKEAMAARGFFVRTTPANFVLMQVPDPRRFCALLEEEGVYVRDRSQLSRMENFIRITIPTSFQVKELIKRFDAVLSRVP